MSDSNPVLVLVAGPEIDLSPLTQHLWAHRIAHRVVEVKGQQHLILASVEHVPAVKVWVEQWRAGELTPPEKQSSGSPVASFVLALAQTPVTLMFVLVELVFFGWMLTSNGWMEMSQPGAGLWPDLRNDPGLYLGLGDSSLGLVSLWLPCLLHFSVMHLLFNGIWWWVLGRAIEQMEGTLALLVLMFVAGYLGNAVQWWYAGPGFGGASGITMALLGWVGWRQYFQKIQYPMPAMLVPLMVGFMLFEIATDTLFPGLTQSAHGAHIGGFVAGALIAAVWKPRGNMPSDEVDAA
ncbi:MAG: rhomboid family intramembrane serine protease [Oceanobacter sp.]